MIIGFHQIIMNFAAVWKNLRLNEINHLTYSTLISFRMRSFNQRTKKLFYMDNDYNEWFTFKLTSAAFWIYKI